METWAFFMARQHELAVSCKKSFIMNMRKILLFLSMFISLAQAKDIQTNAVSMSNAPEWLRAGRVEKVTERMQSSLEWTIRKVQVIWYTDQKEFEKSHELGPYARAVSQKKLNVIRLGPKVNDSNFDQVFAHELTHIISFQKYKEAIPRWLEEGLANHLSKNAKVDYKWLSAQPMPNDVRDLVHPMSGSADDIRYSYQASQALAEMIAKKCDLTNLLRLSVGHGMDNYLRTFCEIPDLNVAYKKWVMQKR